MGGGDADNRLVTSEWRPAGKQNIRRLAPAALKALAIK